jgi:hypothetical protein
MVKNGLIKTQGIRLGDKGEKGLFLLGCKKAGSNRR